MLAMIYVSWYLNNNFSDQLSTVNYIPDNFMIFSTCNIGCGKSLLKMLREKLIWGGIEIFRFCLGEIDPG